MDAVQELFALSCTLGAGAVTQVHPGEMAQALALLEAGEVEAAEALVAALAAHNTPEEGHAGPISISACISISVDAVTSTRGCPPTAEARVSLPLAYPHVPATCSVACSSLTRDEVSALHATLQETASCAALEGRGWLLELPCLIQEATDTSIQSKELILEGIDTRALQSTGLVQEATARGVPKCEGEDAAAGAQGQPRTSPWQPCHLPGEGDGRAGRGAGDVGSGGSGGGCSCSLGVGSACHLQCSGSRASTSGLRVALVRLDHMHNRALYCRTLKSWASDLGITGRIVLPGSSGGSVALNAGGTGAGAGAGLSLILVLLEGETEDVKRFMVQHKTENVDVDSRGRKCRERMMQVVCEEDLQQRGYTDFREVACGSLGDVQAVLAPCGLGSWEVVRRAAGLPPDKALASKRKGV